MSRPGLFERLGASGQVTVVSAPPGSGKTVLLRSWIREAGLEGSAAWVSVGPGERAENNAAQVMRMQLACGGPGHDGLWPASSCGAWPCDP